MNSDKLTINDLVENVKKYNPNSDTNLLTKCYEFAKSAHEGQKRLSGEEYIIHPLNVAMILTSLQMDDEAICGALLHDVVEDTKYSYDDVAKEFSPSIADLVDGVTKLGKVQYTTKEEEEAENLRKMLLAMAKDIRVVIIKLADRLHNMRTLKYQADERRVEIAKETLQVFAPIANRLRNFYYQMGIRRLMFNVYSSRRIP